MDEVATCWCGCQEFVVGRYGMTCVLCEARYEWNADGTKAVDLVDLAKEQGVVQERATREMEILEASAEEGK